MEKDSGVAASFVRGVLEWALMALTAGRAFGCWGGASPLTYLPTERRIQGPMKMSRYNKANMLSRFRNKLHIEQVDLVGNDSGRVVRVLAD